jgi:hypothetical protein
LESIGRQQRPQREVGDREVGEDLRHARAGEAVDRDALEAQELVGDEPARAEREDHRDRRRERWRHERQQDRGVDRGQEPARQAGARGSEREYEADDRAADPDQEGEEQAVPERADLVLLGEDLGEARHRELAAVEQHAREQHGEREDDEQADQEPQDERAQRDGRITAQCGCGVRKHRAPSPASGRGSG